MGTHWELEGNIEGTNEKMEKLKKKIPPPPPMTRRPQVAVKVKEN
jgi:hypothetical protein